MTVMVLRYLILISSDFYDFISPLSPYWALLPIEKIYETLETMFEYISKPFCVVFSTLFSELGNVVKQRHSCLVGYVKDSEFDECMLNLQTVLDCVALS